MDKQILQEKLGDTTDIPIIQELEDQFSTLYFTDAVGDDDGFGYGFYKQAFKTLDVAMRVSGQIGPIAILAINKQTPIVFNGFPDHTIELLFQQITNYLKHAHADDDLKSIDKLVVHRLHDAIPYNPIMEMIQELKKLNVREDVIRDGVLFIRSRNSRTAWCCTLKSAFHQGIEDNGKIFDVFEILSNKNIFAEKMKWLLAHQLDPEDDGNNTVEFADLGDFGDGDVWDGQQRPDPIPGNSAENPLIVPRELSESRSEAVNGDTGMRKADDSKAEDYMIEGITSDPEYDVINQLADLSDLEWVEYAFTNPQTGQRDSYRILNPLYEFNSDFVDDPNALFVLDNEDVVHHVSHLGDDITILKSKAWGKKILGVFF